MEIIYNDVAEYFCEWKYLQEVIKHLEPNLSDKYVLHVACLSVECENYKNVKFVKGKKNFESNIIVNSLLNLNSFHLLGSI